MKPMVTLMASHSPTHVFCTSFAKTDRTGGSLVTETPLNLSPAVNEYHRDLIRRYVKWIRSHGG